MQSAIGAARHDILELEAQNASVTTDNQGGVVISIKKFSGGDGVYDGLVSQLSSTLGRDRSESLLPMVEDSLRMALDQAGHSDQTITLTRNPPSATSPQGEFTMRTASAVMTTTTVDANMAYFAQVFGPLAKLVPANF